jgi:hypothetical protein
MRAKQPFLFQTTQINLWEFHKNIKQRHCTFKRKNDVRSRNHCFSGKAISITYSHCVFVTLAIQHAKHVSQTVICGLPISTEFFHINAQRHNFRERKCYRTQRVFFFLYNIVRNISHSKNISARYGHMYKRLQVNTHHSCKIFTKLEFSRTIFEKYSNINFLNP